MTNLENPILTNNTGEKRPARTWKLSPKDFLFKYLRFLPWVIVSVAFFICLAYIKNRYAIHIYRVQSSLLIKNERQNGNSKDERFEELFMSQSSANLSNEIEILKSTPVLARVAGDLHLQTVYHNKGSVKSSLLYPSSPITIDLMQLGDSSRNFGYQVTVLDSRRYLLNESKTPLFFGQILERGGYRFRMLWDSTVNVHSFGTPVFNIDWHPKISAAQSLVSSLKVIQTNDQATILTLSFESENGTLCQDVLNTLMAVYDTLMVEDKNRIADNTLRFINARLFELSDTLKGVQGGLESFMIRNQAFDMENQSKTYLEKIGDAGQLQSEMEVKLSVVDYLLKYIADKKNIYELVPTNLGIEDAALLQLIGEYNRMQLERAANLKTTPATNPLIANIENTLEKVRTNIYTALTNVRQAYSIADLNINKKNQDLQDRITSLPGKSMQLLNIGRKQKILEDLYSLLLQKKLDISLSSASTISNSRVVEPALGPGLEVSPDTKKTYTFYLLLGLIFPIAIIAIRELMQDKVNDKADIERNTDAPILGQIGHSETDQPLIVTLNSRSLISEQFRIIRSNLQYVIGKNDRPVLMVTSSFSGEGKSFVSTNIGAVMALSGKKTVIMEFDIRKPKIISGLELKRKMGITNYIIGKASFRDLIVKVDGIDNMYVIPCGPIPPNPAEILLDSRLDELMQEVKAEFEVVIMDTAPIGLVSDASTLGKYADCTLYIVRQGHTFRSQLHMIDELYHSRKLPGLSLLLNDVGASGGYYGYYGGGYGYYAGYGYGAGSSGYFEDEKGKRKRTILGRLSRSFSRIFNGRK